MLPLRVSATRRSSDASRSRGVGPRIPAAPTVLSVVASTRIFQPCRVGESCGASIPGAGVEPALERLLRAPPLPVGLPGRARRRVRRARAGIELPRVARRVLLQRLVRRARGPVPVDQAGVEVPAARLGAEEPEDVQALDVVPVPLDK